MQGRGGLAFSHQEPQRHKPGLVSRVFHNDTAAGASQVFQKGVVRNRLADRRLLSRAEELFVAFPVGADLCEEALEFRVSAKLVEVLVALVPGVVVVT